MIKVVGILGMLLVTGLALYLDKLNGTYVNNMAKYVNKDKKQYKYWKKKSDIAEASMIMCLVVVIIIMMFEVFK